MATQPFACRRRSGGWQCHEECPCPPCLKHLAMHWLVVECCARAPLHLMSLPGAPLLSAKATFAARTGLPTRQGDCHVSSRVRCNCSEVKCEVQSASCELRMVRECSRMVPLCYEHETSSKRYQPLNHRRNELKAEREIGSQRAHVLAIWAPHAPMWAQPKVACGKINWPKSSFDSQPSYKS